MCPLLGLLRDFLRVTTFTCFVVRAEMSVSGIPLARNACGVASSLVNVLTAPVEPRGFEPRTSAVQRRRSPS